MKLLSVSRTHEDGDEVVVVVGDMVRDAVGVVVGDVTGAGVSYTGMGHAFTALGSAQILPLLGSRDTGAGLLHPFSTHPPEYSHNI